MARTLQVCQPARIPFLNTLFGSRKPGGIKEWRAGHAPRMPRHARVLLSLGLACTLATMSLGMPNSAHTMLSLGLVFAFMTTSTASPTTEANLTVLNGFANVTPSVLAGLFTGANQLPFNLSYAQVYALSPARVAPQVCPRGAWAPANAQTCTLCPPGTYSATLAAGSSATCTPCPQGTYSSRAGASASSDCSTCPLNTYFEGTGATSQANCTACPPNSGTTQPYLKINCICNPGYNGSAGQALSQHPLPCPRAPNFWHECRRTLQPMQRIVLLQPGQEQPLSFALHIPCLLLDYWTVPMHAWLLWRPLDQCSRMPGALKPSLTHSL